MSSAPSDSRPAAGSLDLLIKRNCSMTPRAVMLFLAITTAISFTIGALFAWHGLWLVLPFAGIEMAALAVAFYVNGLHATDYERIALRGNEVVVEIRDGERLESHVFNVAWVRLLVTESRRQLRLALASHGKEVEVGRHLDVNGRALLARELERVCGVLAVTGVSSAKNIQVKSNQTGN